MSEKITKNMPGIILSFLIALIAKFLANYLPNLGGVTLAIILGLILGNTISLSSKYDRGIFYSRKKILAFAIMLMGLRLNISVLAEMGVPVVLIIITAVITTILIAGVFGKIFGLNKKFSLLLGVGSSICGSSAIAAAAPLITDNEEEIALSIGVVNLLGTIGILILPLITYFLAYNDIKSSVIIGGTLQAVGHVVAAGFSINENIGNLATVVKMGRILMLGPVVLFLAYLNNTKSKEKSKVSIPPFIIGFFIFALISSLNLFPEVLSKSLLSLSKYMLLTAMAAIGINIKIKSLIKQGPLALSTGAAIFTFQLVFISLMIKFLL